MANPPSFVPRDFLEVPGFFGEQRDVEWILAADYSGAVRLVWAIEQHELALAMHFLMVENNRSILEVAAILEMKRRNLWPPGRALAQEDDLIMWSWLTGTTCRTRPPRELLLYSSMTSVPSIVEAGVADWA